MADEPAVDPRHQELLDALANRDQQLAAAGERLARMEETLNALRPQQPQQNPLQPPPGKRYVIPPAVRQQIAGLGLTDTEIEKNGDLIVPFIQAYMGGMAQELLAIMRSQADDIQQINMLRDVEQFPHAETLYKDIVTVRRQEAEAGRYMPVDVAYRVALANNYDKIAGAGTDTAGGAPGGQFGGSSAPGGARSQVPPANPVGARARDASAAGSFRTMRSPVVEPERPVTRADDLMSMSREERKAFFEANRETPVR